MPLFSKKNSKPGDTLYNKFEGTELEEFTRKHREDCNRIEHLAHSWTNSYGEAYQLGMSTENAKVFNGVHEAAYHLQGVKTAKEPMKSWTYNQMPHLSTMLYSEEDKLRDLEGRCGFTRDRSKIGRNEKLAKITASKFYFPLSHLDPPGGSCQRPFWYQYSQDYRKCSTLMQSTCLCISMMRYRNVNEMRMC